MGPRRRDEPPHRQRMPLKSRAVPRPLRADLVRGEDGGAFGGVPPQDSTVPAGVRHAHGGALPGRPRRGERVRGHDSVYFAPVLPPLFYVLLHENI